MVRAGIFWQMIDFGDIGMPKPWKLGKYLWICGVWQSKLDFQTTKIVLWPIKQLNVPISLFVSIPLASATPANYDHVCWLFPCFLVQLMLHTWNIVRYMYIYIYCIYIYIHIYISVVFCCSKNRVPPRSSGSFRSFSKAIHGGHCKKSGSCLQIQWFRSFPFSRPSIESKFPYRPQFLFCWT